jgi:hypothetical protein
LPDRQVGVVAQTLFQNRDTYDDASGILASLDPPISVPENDVAGVVQLRTVPDSRLMIVAARGDNADQTAAISGSMADALSKAFEDEKYPALTTLGHPQPAPAQTAGSIRLFAMLGAITAFLLALGVSIAHYRLRRPVLEFGAMMALLSPTTVVAVSARKRWLGVLRHIAPVSLSRTAKEDVAQRLRATGGVGSIQWPGASARRLTRIMKLVRVRSDPATTATVIVAEPCSRSRDLSEAALIDPVGTLTVLWLT